MSMFQNPDDEEKLCQILKAYVEEWGPDSVVVTVPRHWRDYGGSGLGRVRLRFETGDSVVIHVEVRMMLLVKYEVKLQIA